MILLSHRKDYYDHLIHQFGRDEKIIFKREFDDYVVNDPVYKKLIRYGKDLTPFSYDYNFKKKTHKLDIKVILFCAIPVYIISCDNGAFELLGFDRSKNEVIQDLAVTARVNSWRSNIMSIYSMRGKYTNLMLKQFVFDSDLVALHKLVNSPILEIRHNDKTSEITLSTAPDLKTITGFCERMPAEQAYQQIQCFIGQHLTKGLEPPIEISDKDKIISHGFDLKSSFRGK